MRHTTIGLTPYNCAFYVSAHSSLFIQNGLQPDKVTATCPQRLAELDPHSSHILKVACERFKDGSEACRLSLTMLSRIQTLFRTLCKPTQRGITTTRLTTRRCAWII